jgi:hypothetical protein
VCWKSRGVYKRLLNPFDFFPLKIFPFTHMCSATLGNQSTKDPFECAANGIPSRNAIDYSKS